MRPHGSGHVTTVAQALDAARQRLAAAGVPSPGVDARLLTLHVLGWSPTDLALRGGQELDDAAAAALATVIADRADRVPLQVLLGSWAFHRVELTVRPDVFIPRPETELLVELALEVMPADAVVVEPCTGTGAIAAALAAARADVRVEATDVDPAAVTLARHNTAPWRSRVEVREGDLLAPVPTGLRGHVDVLVSNPPYLAPHEVAGLEPEVTTADPRRALVAGPTGHEVTDRLIEAATTWLGPSGWLLVEIDPGRAAETVRRCQQAGLRPAAAVADLTGRPRFVRAAAPAS